MYLIQKCIKNNVKANDYPHCWESAWSHDKSYLSDCSLDEAISTFYERTKKVRKAPYRLVSISHSQVVLASINTSDADSYKRYQISAVGFNDLKVIQTASQHCDQMKLEELVKLIAERLTSIVATHDITVRCNSNGRSGGAWLVTSPVNGLMSNADVGISYSLHTGSFTLRVSNKFLSNAIFGNKRCPFSQKMDHQSEFGDLNSAIEGLIGKVRTPTPFEMELLCETVT